MKLRINRDIALPIGRQILLSRWTERKFRQWVLDLAHAHGWLAYFTWSSVHSVPGFPDLVLVRDERCIIAELKTQQGKTTPSQDVWLEALARVPCLEVHLWRPFDEDGILAALA